MPLQIRSDLYCQTCPSPVDQTRPSALIANLAPRIPKIAPTIRTRQGLLPACWVRGPLLRPFPIPLGTLTEELPHMQQATGYWLCIHERNLVKITPRPSF